MPLTARGDHRRRNDLPRKKEVKRLDDGSETREQIENVPETATENRRALFFFLS